MLSKRLNSLMKYVEKTDNIIDIGCDHALLSINLINSKIIEKIIVSDISKNALEQGIKNIKKYNLAEYIEPRVGNGLEVLTKNDNINTIIISGMGTNTILKILNSQYLNKINKLILQSNKDYYELRNNIIKLGFIIKNEEVIIDNDKLYINIIFIRGKKIYELNELKYGTNQMINKDLYYNYLIIKKEKILKYITDINLKEEIKNEIKYLKQNMNN